LIALDVAECPAIVRHQGYWLSRAGPNRNEKDHLKPALEEVTVHPRVRLGEVRERARPTEGLKTQRLLRFVDDGYQDLVGTGSVARQNEGNAMFSFHSFRTPRMPPLASLDVGPIGDAPVEEDRLVHIIDPLRWISLERRLNLGDALRGTRNVCRACFTP